jgi:hypothetical protein
MQRIESAITNGLEFLCTPNDLAVKRDSVRRQQQEHVDFALTLRVRVVADLSLQ